MQATNADPIPIRKRWIGIALFLITALSAHLQLRAVLETEVVAPIRADARDYFAGAVNLMTYGVYSRQAATDGTAPPPDAVRTPGYPLLLRVLLGNGSSSVEEFLLRVTLVQAIMGLLLAPLSYLIAVRLLPKAGAVGVALAVALTPQLVTSSTYLLTETTFAFVFCLAMIALLSSIRSPASAWLPLVAGLLLGYACLVRPAIQYLPLVLAAGALAWRGLPNRKRMVAFVLIGFALTWGGYVVRNMASLGQASDPTGMINQLHHGSYPGLMYQDVPATYGYPYRSDPDSARITASVESALQNVVDQFKARPLRMFVWYAIEKPFYFVSWEPIQGMGDVFIYEVAQSPYLTRPEFVATKSLMRLLHWPLMMLGYLGALAAWLPAARRLFDRESLFALRATSLIMLYVVAIHMVGAPFPRYSVPFRPLQYALAGAAIVFVLRHFRTRGARV